ncbi:hypothetical protein Scel_30370 [Streptomyces cellostaticus]|nr:hypothetical protein Scel_30370 [Streptomyces cellostaticus]
MAGPSGERPSHCHDRVPRPVHRRGPCDVHLRKAYVAPGVMLECMVAGAIMVVVVLEIFEESAYLIDEADAQ